LSKKRRLQNLEFSGDFGGLQPLEENIEAYFSQIL
jgi:hypothetical protein